MPINPLAAWLIKLLITYFTLATSLRMLHPFALFSYLSTTAVGRAPVSVNLVTNCIATVLYCNCQIESILFSDHFFRMSFNAI